jgi:Rod binding domain-containing protein
MIESGNYLSALTAKTFSEVDQARLSNEARNAKVNAGNGKDDAMLESAKQFEDVFIDQLLKMMFETVEVDHMFGGGHAEETFRGMLVDEYGSVISKSGGIGLSDDILRSLNSEI